MFFGCLLFALHTVYFLSLSNIERIEFITDFGPLKIAVQNQSAKQTHLEAGHHSFDAKATQK